MSILENILDIVRMHPKFQDYINRKANIKGGCKFTYHSNNTTIEEVFSEYDFSDIQRDDIVLDIGANVGGFSMFVSKFTKHVYAFEPVLIETLKQNIELNNIKNISADRYALGKVINWAGRKDYVEGKTLTQLVELCGGHVDFLKCDCEGGEWSINPSELKSIRRVEIEVHNVEHIEEHAFQRYLDMLSIAGFTYTYVKRDTDMIVHARRNKLCVD